MELLIVLLINQTVTITLLIFISVNYPGNVLIAMQFHYISVLDEGDIALLKSYVCDFYVGLHIS